MINNELCNILNNTDALFLVIDDEELNPIEKLIISSNKNGKIVGNKFIKENRRVVRYKDEKIIRFLTFKDIGIRDSWSKYLFNKSKKCSENIFILNSLDCIWVLFIYVHCYCTKDFWLYKNVLGVIKKRLNINNVQEISLLFDSYLNDNNFRFNWLKLNNFNIKLVGNGVVSLFQSKILKIKKLQNKFVNAIVSKIARFQIIVHDKKTRGLYIERIGNVFTGKKMVILNKKGESASGCIFAKIEDEQKTLFIKGNESPLYHSLENEINIQIILKTIEGSKDIFLLMEKYDEKHNWIAFPFVDNQTLKEYIKKRAFTKQELDMLGEFLLDVLDKLNYSEIIHRDIRLENIMVIEDNYGSIKSFLLFDFGFSVFSTKDIWRSDRMWDKHIVNVVGGVYRYNDYIIDDAAAAHYVYLLCGGKKSDQYACKIRRYIGNRYLV